LGGLRQRRTAVIRGRLGIFRSGLLTHRGRLLIVGLLVVLVVHVAIRLSHVHVALALVAVVSGLRSLVRVRRLRRLHEGSGRLRRSGAGAWAWRWRRRWWWWCPAEADGEGRRRRWLATRPDSMVAEEEEARGVEISPGWGWR